MVKREIDIKQFKKNYKYLKSKINSKIMPIVKADAYGNGVITIAKKCQELGSNFFGVAFLESALTLKENGINSNILILNYVKPERLKEVISNNFRITIYSLEQLEIYYKELGSELKKLKIHININTGMNRLGINIEDLKGLENYHLDIEGAYTHFFNAGASKKDSEKQYKEYLKGVETLEKQGYKIDVKHIANSAGALIDKRYSLDYVRAGMILYGLQPIDKKEVPVSPILKVKTVVSNITNVKKGVSVGYGNSYLTSSNMKIATIPIGYADGYPMALSNRGYVLIDGKRCKLVGKVSMEQIMVDVSHVKKVKIGSEVVILGEQNGKRILPGELADLAKTVPDDIICKLNI